MTANEKKRAKYQERIAAGMCGHCDTPALEGKKRCEKHVASDAAIAARAKVRKSAGQASE